MSEWLAQARAAQVSWAAMPVSARVRALAPVLERLQARSDEVAAAVEREAGAPLTGALGGEVLGAVEQAAHWLATIERRLEPDELAPAALRSRRKEGRASREARGVVALIGFGRSPVAGALGALAAALLAGNAVAFAPAAAGVGAVVVSVLEGLLPHGLLTAWRGSGAELAGEAVDHVVFAGDERLAGEVAAACARRLGGYTLRLDGEGAAVVLADADIERAARGVAWGAWGGVAGQTARIDRVWVEGAVAGAFGQRLGEQAAALRPGLDVPAGFTPALEVQVVSSVDEALHLAAARPLESVSLWTSDRPRAQVLAERLRVGLVTVNTHGLAEAHPGAQAASASVDLLAAVTRPRLLLVDRSVLGPEPWWFPYGPALHALVRTLIAQAAGGWRARWTARLARGPQAVSRRLEQRRPGGGGDGGPPGARPAPDGGEPGPEAGAGGDRPG